MKKNYQNILEDTLKGLVSTPTLLVHSCCAPCSSYVLEYLSEYFEITVFYYNPNIFPDEEFRKRAEEQKRLISEMNFKNPVHLIVGAYEPERFMEAAKGLENEPEGGARCTECFKLRLKEACLEAKKGGFDYFTTTLSISPLKDAERLNTLGLALEQEYGVKYLQSDFKKKNGYRRSVELSSEHHLYRQNFCGCVFSKRDAERRARFTENTCRT